MGLTTGWGCLKEASGCADEGALDACLFQTADSTFSDYLNVVRWMPAQVEHDRSSRPGQPHKTPSYPTPHSQHHTFKLSIKKARSDAL
jgi:hypothetical protein